MESSWIYSLHAVILLQSVTVIILVQCEHGPVRKPEKLFANSTMLRGRTVTCDNVRPSDGKFASDTWTCYNMKVDGLRVRYWYIPGFGADEGCSDGKDTYDSKNNFAELCRHLMRAHGNYKELWVAFVNEASCQRSPDKRMLFTQTDGIHQWEKFEQGNGYIITFRCMAMNT